MKQLLFAYTSCAAGTKTPTSAGQVALLPLTTMVNTTSFSEDFAILNCVEADVLPLSIPEVNWNTLTVRKTDYKAPTTFKAVFSIPAATKDSEYTIIFVKTGTTINERYKYTTTVPIKNGTTAANAALALQKSINNNSQVSGLKATVSSATLTVEATTVGVNYAVVTADDLMSVSPTSTVTGSFGSLTSDYIANLASECASDRGYNHLSEDGKDIYPGYNEFIAAYNQTPTNFGMYTLRFAVPRVAAKQRDEVVYQTVHIIYNKTLASAFASLDKKVVNVTTTTTTSK